MGWQVTSRKKTNVDLGASWKPVGVGWDANQCVGADQCEDHIGSTEDRFSPGIAGTFEDLCRNEIQATRSRADTASQKRLNTRSFFLDVHT